MSLVGDRAAIAAALSTVDGVTGHEYRPTTARAGDAWPLLGPMDRGPASAWEVTWRVLVLLPQDERAAAMWLDSHVDALVDALESHVAYVDRVEPATVQAAGRDQLAVMVTMRSE